MEEDDQSGAGPAPGGVAEGEVRPRDPGHGDDDGEVSWPPGAPDDPRVLVAAAVEQGAGQGAVQALPVVRGQQAEQGRLAQRGGQAELSLGLPEAATQLPDNLLLHITDTVTAQICNIDDIHKFT